MNEYLRVQLAANLMSHRASRMSGADGLQPCACGVRGNWNEGYSTDWGLHLADAAMALVPPTQYRDEILREAAATQRAQQDRREAEELGEWDYLDHETELQGAAVRAMADLIDPDVAPAVAGGTS
jgi:hypothetical protein